MKIRDGFTIKDIVGEKFVLPTEKTRATFTGALVLNEVSVFVFQKLQNELTYDELIKKVTDEYNVSEVVAKKDINALLDIFREHGMLEES